MNAEAIIKELQDTYPGKLIKCLPEDEPTEIICEFDPKDEHPEFSLAIAVINRSKPHFHRRTTEIYRVVKGELKLHVGEEEYTMYEGQEWTIVPGQVHWAEGNEAWVEVYCSPGYEASDHILAE
jgi:mannose-6-phosphate isomerase-like protein (cupin superfamily)